MENNKELEQSQVEAIVAKYGELQSDGDTTTELAQLKALLAQTTVTEDKILKDYKAYKDGQLITGTSFDVSNISGFKNLTEDNFIVGAIIASSVTSSVYPAGRRLATAVEFMLTKTYDSNTGILTIVGNRQLVQCVGEGKTAVYQTMVVNCWLIQGETKMYKYKNYL